MSRAPLSIRSAAALALTLSLGFGAVQALAAPRAAQAAPSACSNSSCSWSCVKQGYDGGACNAEGECVCLYAFP